MLSCIGVGGYVGAVLGKSEATRILDAELPLDSELRKLLAGRVRVLETGIVTADPFQQRSQEEPLWDPDASLYTK